MLQERKSKLAESRGIGPQADRNEAQPTAPRAGADLRAARERVGWSLPDLAAALHIRQAYLEALEGGRISELPGNAYALGFLRTYAIALGLDAREITRRFKAEAAPVNLMTKLAFPVPVPARGIPAGAVALLGVVLAVAVYAGWYRLSGEGELPAETIAQIPMHLASLADQAIGPPTAPVISATAAPPKPVEPSLTQQAEDDTPIVPAISPGSAAAAMTALPVPPVPAEQSDQSRIQLRANADAWVQVRDKAGPVLLSRVLHPGETWAVPAKPNLLLTTGNAGGTDLVVDGVATGSLGGNGVVRRDLPLDPDLIKDGRLAAASPRASAQ